MKFWNSLPPGWDQVGYILEMHYISEKPLYFWTPRQNVCMIMISIGLSTKILKVMVQGSGFIMTWTSKGGFFSSRVESSVELFWSHFVHKHFWLIKNHKAYFSWTVTKHAWVKRIQVRSNEVPCPFWSRNN